MIIINSLKDMLEKSGKVYGSKTAYKIRKNENEYLEITHNEVRQMVDALGTSLVNMGLKNKKIGVIGENRYEWEIAYLSIVCGTGIVVPLDKSLPDNELKRLIERSEIEAIFYSKKYTDFFTKGKIGKLKYLISMDIKENNDLEYSQYQLIREGNELLEKGNKEFVDAQIDNKKMSIMLFTSGTTSEAKAVALSHWNICSNLMDMSSILEINSDDIFLSFLPLHHVFECTVGFLLALYQGAETVFCDGIRHIPENMREYKVSVMASVPAIYERLFKLIQKKLKEGKSIKQIHEMLGGNIKLMISGAASLDKQIEKAYRKQGFNIVQGYGLTETSPVVAIGTKENYKEGSIGKPIPSDEVKIINSNSEGIGELCIKGPNVMLEYYQNPKATEEVLKDGWFHTGDLARIDNEGFIFICGRKKNVIVLKNGKNIFPEEIENMINKEDGIEESFIFGKPQSEDKDNIKIFAKIIYNQEYFQNKTKDEIYEILTNKIKKINIQMPKYKAIRGIILSTEPLIKTTTNKIKREKNLERILKEEI